MATAAVAACTLYLLTPAGIMPVKNLTLDDASAKFWEYSENYPDVIMEAVYCGDRLKLILDTANTAQLKNAVHLDPGAVPK